MTTLNRISATSLLAAASLTLSSPAWALGLGDVTVESFLNQPLQVKIDLLSRETDDMASVTAKLASADDYELIGASRDAVPVPIRFTVEDSDGDAYILGTSTLPISSPVVRLIVEVNYSSGRLLREYTVFLDPATITAEPAPIPRLNASREPVAPPVAATQPEQLEDKPAPSPQAPAASPVTEPSQARQPADGEYGPVSSGETLWGIASNWSRGTGLDINKVMIAIQRENPQAFMKDNINLLKRGAILRMPRADDVRTISTATAISEVAAQTEEFRGGSYTAPATSTSTPLLAEETAPLEPEQAAPEAGMMETERALSETSAEEAEEVAEETTEEPAEAAAEDLAAVAEDVEPAPQLELVPPSEASDLDSAYGFEESLDENMDASVAVASLREDLSRTEEELINQQQQNEYMEQRIRELEAQLASADDGNVKDADLANMEERLRQERQAATAKESSPWYSGLSAWLIGLLVLAAGLIGWLLSRRGGEQYVSDLGSGDEQLREIKDEAEEVLRVLDDSEEVTVVEAAEEVVDDVEQENTVTRPFGGSSDDAEVLDEESSDPEIQLDLARAYISMGDKEAARVILEEVENNGNDAQREEAKKMLGLMAP